MKPEMVPLNNAPAPLTPFQPLKLNTRPRPLECLDTLQHHRLIGVEILHAGADTLAVVAGRNTGNVDPGVTAEEPQAVPTGLPAIGVGKVLWPAASVDRWVRRDGGEERGEVIGETIPPSLKPPLSFITARGQVLPAVREATKQAPGVA